jgi:protocatechuate 3,4-dioxygenase beta subunit
MKRVEIWLVPILFIVIKTVPFVQLSAPLPAQPLPGRGERPVSPSKREGVITGRVVIDGGQPASDAVIEASAIAAGMFLGTHRTESDDHGHFKLVGLKPGVYQIRASLPGYVSLRNDSDLQLHRTGENVEISLVRGGVLTGRVTDAHGVPLEVVSVNLFRVRDLEGRDISTNPLSPGGKVQQCLTDDRGIYRAYGLPPGVYLISVTDVPIPSINNGSIPHDSPTYYPSVRREAATAVTLRSGEEVTGIDIRHRGEKGHRITGAISRYSDVDLVAAFNVPAVFLANEASKEIEAGTYVMGSGSFGFYGVPDGVYELRAQGTSGSLFSARNKITVKGTDIDDLDLRLFKAGSISGRVVVESPKSIARCGQQDRPHVEEFFLRMRKIDAMGRDWREHLIAVNEKGDFVKSLEDGEYRIIPDLPGDNWYVKAITRTTEETSNKPLDIARDGISVKLGESLTGIEATVTEGAAGLRGRVATASEIPAGEKTASPSRWRVHLVPAEEAAAEDVLRYAETVARSDGTFELKRLAPGRYFLLVRQVSEKEVSEGQSRPVVWDHRERAKLRREAQELKREIELGACQHVTDYLLGLSEKMK